MVLLRSAQLHSGPCNPAGLKQARLCRRLPSHAESTVLDRRRERHSVDRVSPSVSGARFPIHSCDNRDGDQTCLGVVAALDRGRLHRGQTATVGRFRRRRGKRLGARHRGRRRASKGFRAVARKTSHQRSTRTSSPNRSPGGASSDVALRRNAGPNACWRGPHERLPLA